MPKVTPVETPQPEVERITMVTRDAGTVIIQPSKVPPAPMPEIKENK